MSLGQIGLGTYALAWAIGVSGYPPPAAPLDAFAFIQVAHDLGLRLVQIADNIPLHTLTTEERARLRDQAKSLGVAVEVGTRGIQPENIRAYLDIAAFFESPLLRVVVDAANFHPSPDEIIAITGELLPDLERRNITLGIENHDRFRAHTLADIMTAVKSPLVGIVLDTVNSFGSLEGPDVVVETLGRYVVNLHIKDFTIRRADHNMGFTISGAPAGAGMLDLPWLFGKLDGFGRDYNAILETWPAPEATMDATIAKERAWVEQSVGYLRDVTEGSRARG
jgi:sugar phosphate isomerase/epimerase